MSRIAIPQTADAAPIASQPLLGAVKALLGSRERIALAVAQARGHVSDADMRRRSRADARHFQSESWSLA